MRMYTRQVEDEGGLPVDPLKATHSVDGVTALEFMHYFYDARYKMQWDHTLEAMSVVEHISQDSVVLHQKHKTVWPAAPRESLFVSHIRRVDEHKRDGAHDLYIVCNKDVERRDVPVQNDSDYSSTSTKSHSRNPSVSSVLAAPLPKNDDESAKLFATKLAELEAYRTMCKDQMTSIERLLDQGGSTCVVPQSSILSVKATHLALMVNLNYIIELVKTSKVVIPDCMPSTTSSVTPSASVKTHAELRRESVEQDHFSDDNSTMTASTVFARPDIDVTSDCDEFFDADEFDTESKNGNIKEEEKAKKPTFRADEIPVTGHYDDLVVSKEHGMFSTIDKLALEQLKYVFFLL
uniref:START domain-containing protein n=1 Tax=Caenorhabditis japonica TaxID=281687 RepID=A0A8R1ETY2_CAEJA